jgi:hypothetical protein
MPDGASEIREACRVDEKKWGLRFERILLCKQDSAVIAVDRHRWIDDRSFATSEANSVIGQTRELCRKNRAVSTRDMANSISRGAVDREPRTRYQPFGDLVCSA